MRGCCKSKWPNCCTSRMARAMGGATAEARRSHREGGPLLSALDPYVARSFDDIVAAMDWGQCLSVVGSGTLWTNTGVVGIGLQPPLIRGVHEVLDVDNATHTLLMQ